MVLTLGATALTGIGINHDTKTAEAAGSYDNARIADIAMSYDGEWGGEACRDAKQSGLTGSTTNYPDPDLPGSDVGDGQCRAFVNCVVKLASNNTQWLGGGNGDYFKRFEDLGATRITDVTKLVKGDIVQSGHGVHTYIIVKRVSGSTFQVVDSNSDYKENVDIYNRTVTLDSNNRAYRLGKVSNIKNPDDYAGPGADFNGDGKDDIFWYGPGTDHDAIWYGTSTKGGFLSASTNVGGIYRPVAGDFNGDGRGDIFWYAPGAKKKDTIWYGNATKGSFSSVASKVSGTYLPVP